MSEDNTRLAHIERQIIGLEKDGEASSRLQDRFEMSLQKMSETTNAIRELLAVHDAQIRRQHETGMDIYRTIDDNKRDNVEQHKDILHQIEKSHGDVISKIEKLDENFSGKLAEMGQNLTDHDKRIRALERITFIGLGLAMLAGIIVDKIPWGAVFAGAGAG